MCCVEEQRWWRFSTSLLLTATGGGNYSFNVKEFGTKQLNYFKSYIAHKNPKLWQLCANEIILWLRHSVAIGGGRGGATLSNLTQRVYWTIACISQSSGSERRLIGLHTHPSHSTITLMYNDGSTNCTKSREFPQNCAERSSIAHQHGSQPMDQGLLQILRLFLIF